MTDKKAEALFFRQYLGFFYSILEILRLKTY